MPVGLRAVVDDEELARLLRDKARRARDMSPFFRGPFDKAVTEFYERQFQTQGSAGGSRWAPNRPTTVALKHRPGHGRAGPSTVGQDTRSMRASFTKPGHPEAFRTIRPKYYERGSDFPRTAQLGSIPSLFQSGYPRVVFGRRTGGRVPGREIVPKNLPGWLLKRAARDMRRFIEGRFG